MILKSIETTPYEIQMIVPIKGEISIAPMMAAVDEVYNPTEAMMIAQIKMTALVPVILPPAIILALISS